MLIAVELVVAAVLFGAVKFLAVRRCGLIWLLAVGAMVGCSEPREGSRGDELCPSNLEELVALSAAELERVDVGRMNLICADAVEDLGESELPRLLRRLDEWADDARKAEVRYRKTYEREDRRTIFTRVGSDSQTVYLWSYGDGGQSRTFGDARPPRQFLPSGK